MRGAGRGSRSHAGNWLIVLVVIGALLGAFGV
jgi:hypothetical protein